MIASTPFSKFLELGIIKTKRPDVFEAKSLVDNSRKRKEFLEEIKNKLTDDNANFFIENSYDIIMGLIRAKLIAKGYKARGERSHEAEISYLQELGFSIKEITFMNKLRYYRNGIKYYGSNYNKKYAEKVIEFTERMYHLLFQKS